MALTAGTVLNGRYRVLRMVSQGGMGVVYEAVDERHNRRIALKQVLLANDAATLRRYKREVSLLTRVDHPGIPYVYENFFEAGLPYLALEFVEGQTLEDRVPRGTCVAPEVAVGWMREILEVLIHLHGQDPPIVLRDLKPGNVMVTSDGTLKVIDFGIAWSSGGTAMGTLAVGTPGYAPPEQYASGTCDPVMDLYALGATAYRLLSGQDPPPSVTRLIPGSVLPSVRALNPRVPMELAALVERMLSVQPRSRPQTAAEVLRALERI